MWPPASRQADLLTVYGRKARACHDDGAVAAQGCGDAVDRMGRDGWEAFTGAGPVRPGQSPPYSLPEGFGLIHHHRPMPAAMANRPRPDLSLIHI